MSKTAKTNRPQRQQHMTASHKEELAHRLVVITRDKHTYEPPKSHFTYFETNNADAECVFTLV